MGPIRGLSVTWTLCDAECSPEPRRIASLFRGTSDTQWHICDTTWSGGGERDYWLGEKSAR